MNNLKYLLRIKKYRQMDKSDINMEELKNLQNQGAIIIDVRSPQEYKEGHLNNSIVIPEYELKYRAKEMLPDKTKTIIVYCSSGLRSKKAQRILMKIGYTNVYNLYQGLNNY